MTKIEHNEFTQDEFIDSIYQLLQDLRYWDYKIDMHQSMSVHCTERDTPRTFVSLGELPFFLADKGEEMGDEDFHNSDYAHRV